MCGISGILLTKGEVEAQHLSTNNKIMHHRGPDSSGCWISNDKKIGFSQSRLSIVDLDSRSSQPMHLANGRITIVFNGEIYNYMSLKNKLSKKYKFNTTSDTEVLGYCYLEYGLRLFDEIEGMFAFAIYDSKKNKTLIARDFIGQKPLVYFTSKKGLFFSSEIPVLLDSKEFKKEVDFSALGVFLTQNFAHIPQPFTPFTQIKKLKPGHYLIVKNGKVVSYEQFFRFKKDKILEKKDEFDFISKISDEMKPRDVTYSSFLSGGNDSSLVCAALKKDNKETVEAYTLRLGKKDSDFSRSQEISKLLKLKQHTVDFNPNFFLRSVEEQVKKYGEPYFHLTSVYADYILKEVRKNHKVIFTGAGGDEVYYGYNNLNLLAVDKFLKNKKFVPKFILSKLIGKKYNFLYNSNLENVKLNYYISSYEDVSHLFSKSIDTKPYFAEVNQDFFKFAEIKNFIDLSYMSGLVTENSHSLTIQSDLVGMKNSVEIRCPFLERRIIQRGYSLSLNKKIDFKNPREGKKILKRSLSLILPKRLVYAKKIGFGVEISKTEDIIRTNSKKIKKKLSSLAQRKEFDKISIKNLISDDYSMKRNFTLVMKLYALEIWFEEFID